MYLASSYLKRVLSLSPKSRCEFGHSYQFIYLECKCVRYSVSAIYEVTGGAIFGSCEVCLSLTVRSPRQLWISGENPVSPVNIRYHRWICALNVQCCNAGVAVPVLQCRNSGVLVFHCAVLQCCNTGVAVPQFWCLSVPVRCCSVSMPVWRCGNDGVAVLQCRRCSVAILVF